MAISISWTKSFSSSDDGTVLGGADLGTLQSDIEGHTHTGLATEFVNLDDVDISSPAQGDVVFYDESNFTSLGQSTAGKVLRTEGSASDPTWGYPANLTIASEAEGDILYRNGTVWARLAKGTASQVLTMNSGADAPEWSGDVDGLTYKHSGEFSYSPADTSIHQMTMSGELADKIIYAIPSPIKIRIYAKPESPGAENASTVTIKIGTDVFATATHEVDAAYAWYEITGTVTVSGWQTVTAWASNQQAQDTFINGIIIARV